MKKYLVKEDKIPITATFPVIDAHNHLWGNWDIKRILKTMEEVGVISYCDLTGNVNIEFSGGGYILSPRNISDFFNNCSLKYPGKFYCFTMANFTQPVNKCIFLPNPDSDSCVKRTLIPADSGQ